MKKKSLMEILAGGTVLIAYKFYSDRKYLRERKKQNEQIAKREAVLCTYEQWIGAFQNKQYIPEYLYKNDYHKVAVYGLGRLGKQLYKELAVSDIEVVYTIDLAYGGDGRFYNQIPCFHPDDDLPETDLIIVTIPGEAREIIPRLRGKVTCQVKSINELLFVL